MSHVYGRSLDPATLDARETFDPDFDQETKIVRLVRTILDPADGSFREPPESVILQFEDRATQYIIGEPPSQGRGLVRELVSALEPVCGTGKHNAEAAWAIVGKLRELGIIDPDVGGE